MGADFAISSQLGRGTRAVLSLVTKFSRKGDTNGFFARADSLVEKARGMHIDRLHFLNLACDSTSAETTLSTAVCNSISECGKDWLECKTSTGAFLTTESRPYVDVILEDDYVRLLHGDPEQFSAWTSKLAESQMPFLIIAGSIGTLSSSISLEDLPEQARYLNQPIGPRKLFRAISSGDEHNVLKTQATLALHSVALDTTMPQISRTRSDPPLGSSAEKRQAPWNNAPANRPSKQARPKVEVQKSPQTSTSQSPAPSDITPVVPEVMSLSAENSSNELLLDPGNNRDPLRTVLLVEDNEINMKVSCNPPPRGPAARYILTQLFQLLVMLMTKLDLKYQCAINGLEAVNMYAANPTAFSLVLMDMSMPVMDGFEATLKIRATERKWRLTPSLVIALTGVTSAESRRRAFDSGVDKYYTKPFRMKEMGDLVKEIREAKGFTE